jgi:hypothetical protein
MNLNDSTRNRRRPDLTAVCLLTSVLCLLSACNLPTPQADTVRNFTLSSPAGGVAAPDAVLVRPVRLAGHLRNRAMAVRVSENEVIYLEDIRWAEPLDEAITQVLRNRLRQVDGGSVITVQIQRCELVRSEHNAIQLTATYTIAPVGGESRSGAFTAAARTWDGKDYGALVALSENCLPSRIRRGMVPATRAMVKI